MPALSKVAKEDWQSAVIERAREAEQRKREFEAAEVAWREAEAGYLDVAIRAKDAGAPVAKLPFTATNGLDMTVTLVDGRGKNSHLDEAALAKRIGARKWKTITKTVIDPAKSWVINPDQFRSKSRNCPFTGWAVMDDLPEALEDPSKRFALGVQWHPEADAASPVIAALVEAAR